MIGRHVVLAAAVFCILILVMVPVAPFFSNNNNINNNNQESYAQPAPPPRYRPPDQPSEYRSPDCTCKVVLWAKAWIAEPVFKSEKYDKPWRYFAGDGTSNPVQTGSWEGRVWAVATVDVCQYAGVKPPTVPGMKTPVMKFQSGGATLNPHGMWVGYKEEWVQFKCYDHGELVDCKELREQPHRKAGLPFASVTSSPPSSGVYAQTTIVKIRISVPNPFEPGQAQRMDALFTFYLKDIGNGWVAWSINGKHDGWSAYAASVHGRGFTPEKHDWQYVYVAKQAAPALLADPMEVTHQITGRPVEHFLLNERCFESDAPNPEKAEQQQPDDKLSETRNKAIQGKIDKTPPVAPTPSPQPQLPPQQPPTEQPPEVIIVPGDKGGDKSTDKLPDINIDELPGGSGGSSSSGGGGGNPDPNPDPGTGTPGDGNT
jgi:hypothetical protein